MLGSAMLIQNLLITYGRETNAEPPILCFLKITIDIQLTSVSIDIPLLQKNSFSYNNVLQFLLGPLNMADNDNQHLYSSHQIDCDIFDKIP